MAFFPIAFMDSLPEKRYQTADDFSPCAAVTLCGIKEMINPVLSA